MSGIVYTTTSFMEPGRCEDRSQDCASWTKDVLGERDIQSGFTYKTGLPIENHHETVTLSMPAEETVTKSENYDTVTHSPTTNNRVLTVVAFVITGIFLAVDAIYLMVKLRKKLTKKKLERGASTRNSEEKK